MRRCTWATCCPLCSPSFLVEVSSWKGKSPTGLPRWLQKAFNVPLVIQMTDDEKFLWKALLGYTIGSSPVVRVMMQQSLRQGEYDPEKGDNLHLGSLEITVACQLGQPGL